MTPEATNVDDSFWRKSTYYVPFNWYQIQIYPTLTAANRFRIYWATLNIRIKCGEVPFFWTYKLTTTRFLSGDKTYKQICIFKYDAGISCTQKFRNRVCFPLYFDNLTINPTLDSSRVVGVFQKAGPSPYNVYSVVCCIFLVCIFSPQIVTYGWVIIVSIHSLST